MRKLSMMVLLLGVCLFWACERKTDVLPTLETNPQPAWGDVEEAGLLAETHKGQEISTEMIATSARQALTFDYFIKNLIEEVTLQSLYYPELSGLQGPIPSLSDARNACPDSELEDNGSGDYVLTLIFGTGGGTCSINGNTYGGTAVVDITGSFFNNNSEIEITLEDFTFNGASLSSEDSGGDPSPIVLDWNNGQDAYRIEFDEPIIYTENGVTTSVSGTSGFGFINRVADMDDDINNPVSYLNNVYEMRINNHTVTCTSATQTLSFTIQTTDDFVFQPFAIGGCGCLTDGTLQIGVNNPIDTQEVIYDFGADENGVDNGNCDNWASEQIGSDTPTTIQVDFCP